MLSDGYSTGGWNCAFCGAFVTHNTYHVCTNMQPAYQGTDVPIILSKDDEIIEKLDKIIELLEKVKQKENRDALDTIEREFGVEV